jgi:hypothetical protein
MTEFIEYYSHVDKAGPSPLIHVLTGRQPFYIVTVETLRRAPLKLRI